MRLHGESFVLLQAISDWKVNGCKCELEAPIALNNSQEDQQEDPSTDGKTMSGRT
jgi:hypothetical protein